MRQLLWSELGIKWIPIFWIRILSYDRIRIFSYDRIRIRISAQTTHLNYLSRLADDFSTSELREVCSEAVSRTHDSGARKLRRMRTSANESQHQRWHESWASLPPSPHHLPNWRAMRYFWRTRPDPLITNLRKFRRVSQRIRIDPGFGRFVLPLVRTQSKTQDNYQA